jgi:hypothetical protein
MKKSSGSPTRTYVRETDAPGRPVPSRTGKESRGWRRYLAAGGAVIILILLILPCQIRRCGGAGGQGRLAYRRVMSGITRNMIAKRPVESTRGPEYAARKDLHELKHAAPHRGAVPAVKPAKKDQDNATERGAVNLPDSHEQLEKIETGEGRAVKPKVYDFGTKLELVTPPEKR